MPTTTTPAAPSAVRFNQAQRGHLIVCAPVRLTPGALGHRARWRVVGTDTNGNPTTGQRVTFTADRQWVMTPHCHPDPTDPTAARGWTEYTAGWADHKGALACPACWPPEVASQ